MGNQPFVPRYKQIYNDLKSKIASGDYASEQQLPYERILCETYGVERITIRRALEMLVQDDLIEKRAGLGSFVKSAPQKRGSGSGTILYVMLSSSNDMSNNASAFNASMFFSMEEVCRARGYTLLYVSLAPGDDLGRMIEERDASGVLLITTMPSTAILAAIQSRRPTICVNHYDPRLLSIIPDNDSGAGMAIDYLAKLGHKRIAYIDGLSNSTNARERRSGYRRAMFENGLRPDTSLICSGQWTHDGGMEAMRMLLERHTGDARPTAVFAANDMMAIGAMDEIRRQGLRIPEDISVIGFDNVEMCTFCTPKLTSINVSRRLAAEVAMEHLTLLMKKGVTEYDNYTLRLPVSFVGRDSAVPFTGRE